MTKLPRDARHNCTVFYDDGDSVEVFAAILNSENLDNFEGWHCDAGHSRIYIHSDGSVWGGECENDYLGSLNDHTFDILQKPTVCKRARCITSADELMLRKFKITE
jgi:hypothetical protein